jgi:hypothetical protein
LKLGVALAVAALALPTFAAAQDPSTRTDLTIIGAVLTDTTEQVADRNAVATPAMPIVYEDEAAADEAAADASDSAANASTATAAE